MLVVHMNGTSIISPGSPMAPDAMHLLTCVKIKSDTCIRVHLPLICIITLVNFLPLAASSNIRSRDCIEMQ